MNIQISTKLDLETINKEIIISNQEDYRHCGDIMKICKNKVKELEEERKTYTQPLDLSKKMIMAKFNEVIDPIKNYIDKMTKAMGDWYLTEQKQRIEEQKKLEEEAIAQAGDNPDVEVLLVESVKTQRGQVATSTAIEYYDYEIEDEKEIPREYLTIDDKKIKGAINKGEEIKGIKIIKKIRINSR